MFGANSGLAHRRGSAAPSDPHDASRYPLYIVPRPGNRFVVGATSIESDSLRPATVRSALELLSAAYALHPAFAEAEIVG